MKIIVISYSFTGNNNALATHLAAEFAAEHIKVVEPKRRTMITIILDLLFNRTPKVNPTAVNVKYYDLVIFVAPVWMGQVATPLRAYFRQLKGRHGQYAFVSISGGGAGANPKLAAELNKRMGKAPKVLIDLPLADLFPNDPKPSREVTSGYHLNNRDVKNLTNKVVNKLRRANILQEIMAD